MSAEQSAQILITRLAGARRMINAGIRMDLRCDDELAVHCVAHSALSAIQDLLRNRAKDVHEFVMARGFFELLKAYARGELSEPLAESVSGVASKIPQDTLQRLKTTELKDVRVELIGYDPRVFWREYRKNFNFLKHALSDPEAVLDPDTLNNTDVLMHACAGYAELNAPLSIEMLVYTAYWASLLPYEVPAPARLASWIATLKECGVPKCKEACRFMIGDTLSISNDED